MTLDDDIYSQVGAGLGAVGAAVLGPVVQVLKEIFKVNSCFREHSVKTPAAEAGKRDKPASQAVPLEQGQVHSLLSLASQEEEEEAKEEIKNKSWTGKRGSSCPQGEVALAVAGRRGKPPLRPTSTTGKQLLLKICTKNIFSSFRFFGLGHLLNLGGNIPHCGSCCYGNNQGFNNNNGGFNNNNGGFNNNNGGFHNNNNNGGFHNNNNGGFSQSQQGYNRCQCEYGLTFRDRYIGRLSYCHLVIQRVLNRSVYYMI